MRNPVGRKSIRKDIVELNNTVKQLELIKTYRILHPTIAEYTFFSSLHGYSSK